MGAFNVDEIKAQAIKELYDEKFRELVDREKEKLKNHKSIWFKLFPFKVLIVRR